MFIVFKWLKKLYDWVLSWAETPYGGIALFLLAFAESSFFPLPPDVLLIALCMGEPRKSLKFALYCSIGSVLGGMLGYAIGHFFFHTFKEQILGFLSVVTFKDGYELYEAVKTYFDTFGVLWVGVAGFTPIPYKVFTITAGAMDLVFIPFVLISAASRSARFFLVAGLIGLLFKKYGEKIQTFIDKYFNLLTILFALLLVLGFLVIKYLR